MHPHLPRAEGASSLRSLLLSDPLNLLSPLMNQTALQTRTGPSSRDTFVSRRDGPVQGLLVTAVPMSGAKSTAMFGGRGAERPVPHSPRLLWDPRVGCGVRGLGAGWGAQESAWGLGGLPSRAWVSSGFFLEKPVALPGRVLLSSHRQRQAGHVHSAVAGEGPLCPLL